MLHWYNNMTNDYKANLMKWLTGNYTPEAQPSEYVSQTISDFQNTNIIYDYVDSQGITSYYILSSVKSVTNSNVAILCRTSETNTTFIVICDSELNPQQLIRNYASGTAFKDIYGLGVGEDGNFFLIENTGSNIRFVMCNNITAPDTTGTYKVVLRKSYNVQNNLTNFVSVSKIVKYPNQSRYLVVGYDTNQAYNGVAISEIVVQVGLPNEYNDFTINYGGETVSYAGDIYYNVSGENITFKITGFGGGKYIEMKNSGYNVSTTGYSFTNQSLGAKAVATSMTESYVLSLKIDGTGYELFHFKNNTLNLLGTITTDSSKPVINRAYLFTISKINEVVFGIVLDDWDSNNYMVMGYTIVNDKFTTNALSESIGSTVPVKTVDIANNSYDLYTMAYTTGNYTIKSTLVYNESRYNGTAYNGLTYFKPSYAEFLSNNKIVFARGLYNFTILNDSSTAVVNIPNQYINNLQFTSSLFGETGGKLINDTTNYEKNIYENVLVNFNNAINITNDDIYKQTPSIRLNNSVLTDLDYNQAKIGYVRLMFAGGNHDIIPAITKTSDTEYEVEFNFYTGDDLNGILILSQDKQTTYDSFKIDYLLNKCYNITRKVEII